MCPPTNRIGEWHERLREASDEAARKRVLAITRPVFREQAEQPAQPRDRIARVHFGQDEAAGHRRIERGRGGRGVGDAAEQDHVRTLRARPGAAAREALAVRPDLAMPDERARGFLVDLVHELDRRLDRDDVGITRAAEVFHARGERRRLARSRAAGDEHQPLALRDELRRSRGRADVIERGSLRRYRPHDRGDPAGVARHLDAEATVVIDRRGKVGGTCALERLADGARGELEELLPRVFREGLLAFPDGRDISVRTGRPGKAHEPAPRTHPRRQSGGEVESSTADFLEPPDERSQVCHCLSPRN